MFEKLKQFKDLRDQAKKIQSVLGQESVTGTSGTRWLGGKTVEVTMNGNQEILKVNIDPEYLSPDKKEKLEGAVAEGVNDAVKKVQKIMATKMREMGGLNLPGMKE